VSGRPSPLAELVIDRSAYETGFAGGFAWATESFGLAVGIETAVVDNSCPSICDGCAETMQVCRWWTLWWWDAAAERG
jgi:hypothetical protein